MACGKCGKRKLTQTRVIQPKPRNQQSSNKPLKTIIRRAAH